jgi:hypothetical protein
MTHQPRGLTEPLYLVSEFLPAGLNEHFDFVKGYFFDLFAADIVDGDELP